MHPLPLKNEKRNLDTLKENILKIKFFKYFFNTKKNFL
jgi:hypothetical protein